MNNEKVKRKIIYEANKGIMADDEYTANDEIKSEVLRLSKEGFPYALELVNKAPAKFLQDSDKEYLEKEFPYILPFYRGLAVRKDKGKKDIEKKQFQEYCQILNAINTIDEMECYIWSYSTIDLLNLFKRFHNKLNNSKNSSEFDHAQALKCIDKLINKLRAEIKIYSEEIIEEEKKNINKQIITEKPTKEGLEIFEKLLNKYPDEYYNEDFLRLLLTNECSKEWIKYYLKAILNNNPAKICGMIIIGINNDENFFYFIEEYLEKLDENDIVSLIKEVKDNKRRYPIIEYYSGLLRNSELFKEICNVYLYKSSSFCEAADRIADLIAEHKDLLDDYSNELYQKLKKYLKEISSTMLSDEVAYAVSTVIKLGYIEEVMCDIVFWDNILDDNIFYLIVDNINLELGYDSVLEMLYKNIQVAKVYEKDNLVYRFLDCFVKMGTNIDSDVEVYMKYFKKLIRDLGEQLTNAIIKKVLDDSVKLKKQLILEREDNERKRAQIHNEMIHNIYNALENLESIVASFYLHPIETKDMLEAIMESLVKLRKGMATIGIETIVPYQLWYGQEKISFDNHFHICTNDVSNGTAVIPLSMGINGKTCNRIEKAIVRLQKEES